MSALVRPLLATACCSLLALSLAAAPKAKPKKVFEAGKPAFTPDPSVPAFDPAAVEPQVLGIDRFHVPEDLEVTLWASSPMLFNPANMDIDHAGRVWIAEGINYRRHSGRSREGDCIRVLQDTDGDGKADQTHVFVREKELECPLGVAVFDNVIVVSNAPSIIVYTDVNRDLVFDPAVDKREVLLTGFEQQQHDHSLHALYGGPDGRWYFSNGNCGALFTDRDGRTFRIGGAYLNNDYAGETSDDGHIYVGGFSASIEPDGTATRIHSFNSRNSFEGVINSFGDMFQNDNDDPPACRVSPIIDGGSFGFFSRDGRRQWRADQRPDQDIPTAEWRQDDPGSIPAGDVYGGGAPTGMAYYENGALQEKYRGLLLSCETGRNTVFGYLPEAAGAGYKLDRFNFLTSNAAGEFKGSDFVGGSNNLSDETNTYFRPSDVCVGPDGAIYVTDWFDPRTGGHQDLDETCSGAIYRIAPKGFKPQVPALDLSTTEGQLQALQSAAVNTRHVGFTRLRAKGDAVLDDVAEILKNPNPYIAARAVWLLAQLGDAGQARVTPLLKNDDALLRLVAFRALKAAGAALVPLASALVEDASSAVRRDVATSLRDVPASDSVPLLVKLAAGYDGTDRSYLEAWGIGCSGKDDLVWEALLHAAQDPAPNAWTPTFARLTWRLHPAAAIPALVARALDGGLAPEVRKLAVDTLAFIPTAAAADAMLRVAGSDLAGTKDDAMWWLIKRSTDDWANFGVPEKLQQQGIFDPASIQLVSITVPEPVENSNGLTSEAVLKLQGNATAGAQVIARCFMCHQVGDTGVAFGPNLTGWGLSQPASVIAEALIDPSKDIAHGFDGTEIVTQDGITIQGQVLTDGDILIVRSMGGQTQYVPKERIKQRKKMTRSLMMSAAQLGLTPQDVADVIAYLKQAPSSGR
ncbi:MAG: c-type cytochrome [Verrucomicrobiales bacterium]|nr:c-type cytochrome [Verrucomicrobiales bacterium]